MERPQLVDFSTDVLPEGLGRHLVQKVRQLKAGLRFVLWLELALILLLLLLVSAFLGLLFILYITPAPGTLWVFTGVSVGVVGIVFFKFIFARRRQGLSNLAVSAWVERSIPELQDRLITAVELAEGVQLASGGTLVELFEPRFVAAFFDQTEGVIRRMFLYRVLFRKRLFALLGVLVVGLLLFENSHHFSIYTAGDLRRIYMDTHLALLRGQGSVFVVEPGDVTIGRGEDLEVKAYSVRPGRKRDMEIFYRAEGQSWESSPMERTENDAFRFLFQQLTQPLEYHVADAQAESPNFGIQLVDRPELSSLRVQLMHPAYTGLGTVIGEEGKGEIEALPGTRAEVVVQFRQHLEKVDLLLGSVEDASTETQIARLRMTESLGNWKGQFEVKGPGWYRISGTSPEGYATGKELTYSIVLLEDQKPEIEIIQPTKPIDFVRTDEFPELREGKHPKVPIQYEAIDEFGVARVELHYSQMGGVTAHRILSEYGYGEKTVAGDYKWDVESLWGGGPVIYFLRAYDHLGAKEEQDTGKTEHYGDSGTLELYWGRDLTPPPEEREAQTQDSDEQAAQQDTQGDQQSAADEKDKERERLAKDLKQLADQANRIRQLQSELDQEVEWKSEEQRQGGQSISPTGAGQMAGRQGELAQQVGQLRRDIRSKAGQVKNVGPPGKTPGPASKSPRQEEEKQERKEEEKQEEQRLQNPEELAARMQEMARALEEQRIEKTPEGFQTRSGVEGEMRLNQQRLAQAQLEEAKEKGEELEGQLGKIEDELREIAEGLGGARGKPRPSQIAESAEGPSKEKPREEARSVHATLSGDSPSMGTEAYDEYRPSTWEPPEMRDLGQKARRLGEFIDAEPERDPFADTPPDERYPLKYEGMVEQYFQALAESEQ